MEMPPVNKMLTNSMTSLVATLSGTARTKVKCGDPNCEQGCLLDWYDTLRDAWLWQEADEAWIDGTLQTHQYLRPKTDIFELCAKNISIGPLSNGNQSFGAMNPRTLSVDQLDFGMALAQREIHSSRHKDDREAQRKNYGVGLFLCLWGWSFVVQGIMDRVRYKQISFITCSQVPKHLWVQRLALPARHEKHKSKLVMDYLERKYNVLEWPAQSLDLNPIENLWNHHHRVSPRTLSLPKCG